MKGKMRDANLCRKRPWASHGKPARGHRQTFRGRLFAAPPWEEISFYVSELSGCDRAKGLRQERHNGHAGEVPGCFGKLLVAQRLDRIETRCFDGGIHSEEKADTH